MKFGSVCSGIEAASVAWEPLGWRASFLSEIDAFPRAVLAHHYPNTPLHGDFTTIGEDAYEPIDLLVGGTPCQTFSIAGMREGLDDDRGNLALQFFLLAKRTHPRWVVWENVPGVLSSKRGRDFGAILGALVELGYGFAYRVLDAQYVRVDGFGRAVPQRRRRLFVIGHLGDWRRAAAVLFERESLCGYTPPSREAGPVAAALTANGVGTCGADDNQANARHLIPSTRGAAHCLTTGAQRMDPEIETFIAVHGTQDPIVSREAAFPIGRNHGQETVIMRNWAVRRLTPTECERLQGFPVGYTEISYRNKAAEKCPDGPRYKAVGNSMAVNVMRWIGQRIDIVETQRAEWAA